MLRVSSGLVLQHHPERLLLYEFKARICNAAHDIVNKFLENIILRSLDSPLMSDRTEVLISRIEKWCEAKRGRQSAIAAHLSVDRQTVNEWIKRRRKPTGEQTLALIEFLDSQEQGDQKT